MSAVYLGICDVIPHRGMCSYSYHLTTTPEQWPHSVISLVSCGAEAHSALWKPAQWIAAHCTARCEAILPISSLAATSLVDSECGTVAEDGYYARVSQFRHIVT
jgi:hypothetical protein